MTILVSNLYALVNFLFHEFFAFLFLEDLYVEKEPELPLTSLQPIDAEPQVSLADTEGDEILATIADDDVQLLRGLSQEFMFDDMIGADSLAKSVTVDGLGNQELSKCDDTLENETAKGVNNLAGTNGDSLAKSVDVVDVLCEPEFSFDDEIADPSIPVAADEIFNNLNAEEEVATEDTRPTTNEEETTQDRSTIEDKVEENRTDMDLPIQNRDPDIENLDDSDDDSIDADDREIDR